MTDETTHYETLFIVHPVHSGRNKELCERYREVLEGRGATITHFEEWGMRDLAYSIEKQGRGFYNLVQYTASAGTSEEFERLMRLSDEVMRCMTVVLDDDVRSLARTEDPVSAPEPAPESEPGTAPAPESGTVPEPGTAPAPETAPESAEETREGSEA